jgi:hypothetical protein
VNKRILICSLIAGASTLIASPVSSQPRTIAPDLNALVQTQGLQIHNRIVTAFADANRKGIRMNAAGGDGVVFLKGVEFSNGTIEFDVRGKDVQGQSFVGVAFHGVDSTTYDAVYFRPFNFLATDSARHAHAVQYISHPTYTWDKLRNEHPGLYEKPVDPAPNPNEWFHARVVVAGPTVTVFVAGAREPSLVVTRLSERTKGLVGLWVGNGSDGSFSNLVIRPAQ